MIFSKLIKKIVTSIKAEFSVFLVGLSKLADAIFLPYYDSNAHVSAQAGELERSHGFIEKLAQSLCILNGLTNQKP